MRVRVRERAKTVVILLSGGIPQREFDGLAVDLDVGDVVLKDGWDVDLLGKTVHGQHLALHLDEAAHLWERALAEDDEQARLSPFIRSFVAVIVVVEQKRGGG